MHRKAETRLIPFCAFTFLAMARRLRWREKIMELQSLKRVVARNWRDSTATKTKYQRVPGHPMAFYSLLAHWIEPQDCGTSCRERTWRRCAVTAEMKHTRPVEIGLCGGRSTI